MIGDRWWGVRSLSLKAQDCTKGRRRLLVTGNQRVEVKAGGLAGNCQGRLWKGLSHNTLVG